MALCRFCSRVEIMKWSHSHDKREKKGRKIELKHYAGSWSILGNLKFSVTKTFSRASNILHRYQVGSSWYCITIQENDAISLHGELSKSSASLAWQTWVDLTPQHLNSCHFSIHCPSLYQNEHCEMVFS